ncbi:sensor histidine kinase [Fictibacillus norfolkensis]|uniref:histidine kinase n=1 Tax=Fictibacillus norfolkensis TaxID=2762233 RepID=A0ABR8SMQ3_9BACL|nr:HAMP domain-containing sensor histidine kinase [Fictibacillus norfolkensis]MBD7964779.1 HAMP domain-containing histidine kinase [Fictibacillus norfolkensis]
MKFKRLRNKLILKLLGAIAVSLLASYLVLFLNALSFKYLYDNQILDEQSVFAFNLLYLVMLSISILVFIIVFLILIRKKVTYLKVISDSVNSIANGKLGLTIKAEGKDELTHLAENINFMSKELENKFESERQIEAAKNELITNVSHDLRTPLTSIIGYLDLLRNKQYQNELELNNYLETTYAKSQRLNSLINELFEYTRLSSSDVKLNLVPVNLSALLGQMIGEYIPIFEKNNMRVQQSLSEEHVEILIDIEKMVRVYENILMNAIKYSEKPSIVKANLDIQSTYAEFRLSNQTEKPEVQDVNQLFERFLVGEKARSEREGTGLGLAISKRIVELHGGHIRAEYNDGWLTIIIKFPI